MPTCSHCGTNYSPRAKWCPVCYTDGGQPRMIRSAFTLPVVGDSYNDPVVGDSQMITGLAWAGALLVLDLEDGSHVEIAPAELRQAESAPETQPDMSSVETIQVSP